MTDALWYWHRIERAVLAACYLAAAAIITGVLHGL